MRHIICALLLAVSASAATVPPGTTIPGSLVLSGVITPAGITTNANNYAPSGLATCSRVNISSAVPCNLTGLTGMSDGRELSLCNVGSFTITLTANSVNSSAGNRFLFSANFALIPNALVLLRGDGTANGWRMVTGAAGTGGTVTSVTASTPLSASAGNAPNITLGTVPIISGGTGQTTQHAAMNALAGGVTGGQYLRGNAINVVLSTIQTGDVPTLNQDTTGTAALASQVSVANDLGNVTAYPMWVVGTGSDSVYVSTSKLTFHPSTGILTAIGYVGPLTGNVTGNVSGSSGSCTGNSATATTAGACTGNSATVTNGVYTAGNQTIAGTKTFSSKITGNITGGCDGNAATATTAAACSGNAVNVTGIVAAAHGGTGINNAGTITNATATTITGGGTLALGGFTLTAPATGSAALLGTANTFTVAQTFKAGPWYDVTAYGATGNGTTDDAVAITAAITACPTGGCVYFPTGTYRVATGISVMKALTLCGNNAGGSIIAGTGISILTVITAGSGATIRDIQILDATGNASTIGVDLQLCTEVRLSNLIISGKSTNVRGIGLNFFGACICHVDNCVVRYWGSGAYMVVGTGPINSNINTFCACHFSSNTTGIYINGADCQSFTGCTFGTNGIGVNSLWGSWSATGCWFENTTTDAQTIGSYAGSGNHFQNASAGHNIIVPSGSYRQVSIGDYFAAGGITHNGTGSFMVLQPGQNTAPAIAGTGIAYIYIDNVKQRTWDGGTTAEWRASAKPTARPDTVALQTGDHYYDTSLYRWYTYNGTVWLSDQVFDFVWAGPSTVFTAQYASYAYAGLEQHATSIYVLDVCFCTRQTGAGTVNDYYAVMLGFVPVGGGATNIAVSDTKTNSANIETKAVVAVNAVKDLSAAACMLLYCGNRQGSAGSLDVLVATMRYRLVRP